MDEDGTGDGAQPAQERAAKRPRRERPKRDATAPSVLLDEGDLSARDGSTRRSRRAGTREVGRVVAVVVVLVLAAAAALTTAAAVSKVGAEAAAAKADAKRYVAPTVAPPGTETPTIAVIGDQTLVSIGAGAANSDRWTTLVSDELSVDVRTTGSDGAGYTVEGDNRRDFESMTSDLPGSADVVVLFGGVADIGSSASALSSGVAKAVDAAREAAPDARLVIVGPVTARGGSTAEMTTLRSRLRTAASLANVQFVDPIASNWFSAYDAASADASELTVDQERRIANRMEALIPLLLG